MKKTPSGTSVGVDDPYAFAGVCDHLTDEGRCRFAIQHGERDPDFARERRRDDYACPIVDPDSIDEGDRCAADRTDAAVDWAGCPHFRSRRTDPACVRCGLEETLIAHTDERPLLEEHHLSYATGDETLDHEITVSLCRWCHAKVHTSWARITDDVAPDPEAIAVAEERRGRELRELDFQSAAKRYSTGDE